MTEESMFSRYSVIGFTESGHVRNKGFKTMIEAEGYAKKMVKEGLTGVRVLDTEKLTGRGSGKGEVYKQLNPGRVGDVVLKIVMRKDGQKTKRYRYEFGSVEAAETKLEGFLSRVGPDWLVEADIKQFGKLTVEAGFYNGQIDKKDWRKTSMKNPGGEMEKIFSVWRYTEGVKNSKVVVSRPRLISEIGISLPEAQNIAKEWSANIPHDRFAVHENDDAVEMYAKGRKVKLVLDNPNVGEMDGALKMAEKFHGRKVKEVVELSESEDEDLDLAVLGILTELEVMTEDGREAVEVSFADGLEGKHYLNVDKGMKKFVRVCTNAEGNQLYFVGGKQDISGLLPTLKREGCRVEDKTRKVLVGELYSISYMADKHHLEGPESQKQGGFYIHQLGEESGIRPMLVFDKVNGKLEVVGGNYDVHDVGIKD